MRQCKTCIHFRRGEWISLTTGQSEGPRPDGYCGTLFAALAMMDSRMVLWPEKEINVQDTFGCVLHKEEKGA